MFNNPASQRVEKVSPSSKQSEKQKRGIDAIHNPSHQPDHPLVSPTRRMNEMECKKHITKEAAEKEKKEKKAICKLHAPHEKPAGTTAYRKPARRCHSRRLCIRGWLHMSHVTQLRKRKKTPRGRLPFHGSFSVPFFVCTLLFKQPLRRHMLA